CLFGLRLPGRLGRGAVAATGALAVVGCCAGALAVGCTAGGGSRCSLGSVVRLGSIVPVGSEELPPGRVDEGGILLVFGELLFDEPFIAAEGFRAQRGVCWGLVGHSGIALFHNVR